MKPNRPSPTKLDLIWVNFLRRILSKQNLPVINFILWAHFEMRKKSKINHKKNAIKSQKILVQMSHIISTPFSDKLISQAQLILRRMLYIVFLFIETWLRALNLLTFNLGYVLKCVDYIRHLCQGLRLYWNIHMYISIGVLNSYLFSCPYMYVSGNNYLLNTVTVFIF
jgi:hypothetical protein